MHLLFIVLFIVSLAPWALLLARQARRERRAGLTPAVNIGEGVHATGNIAFLPDAAMPARYCLVKKGSDAAHVALTGVADVPLGVCTDSTSTSAAVDLSIPLNVQVLGAIHGTVRMTAAGVINDGDLLVPAANGQVRTLPGTTGTYYIVGRALLPSGATAAGDFLEVAPSFPIQRVLP